MCEDCRWPSHDDLVTVVLAVNGGPVVVVAAPAILGDFLVAGGHGGDPKLNEGNSKTLKAPSMKGGARKTLMKGPFNEGGP